MQGEAGRGGTPGGELREGDHAVAVRVELDKVVEHRAAWVVVREVVVPVGELVLFDRSE